MSKRAFAFLALLLALCVAGSLLLGKYGFSAGDYAHYVTALLRGESLKDFEVMHTLLLEIRLPRILACVLIGASLAISARRIRRCLLTRSLAPRSWAF
ncbi:MAG: iron chelate uptake ABC transporter family permease subunit [Campylobacter sp.]